MVKRIFGLRFLCSSAAKDVDTFRYSATVNLPRLKADVFPFFLNRQGDKVLFKVKNRGQLDSKWLEAVGHDSLYRWQLEADERQELPQFWLLDGPPYANGPPHLGHAVNKVLKDMAVRYKFSVGHRVRYRPGWDCHGLPIEIAVSKESSQGHLDVATVPGSSVDGSGPVIELRRRCAETADRWLDVQRTAFQRWGCLADWHRPYKTKDAEYQARQLELLGSLLDRGLVYRAYMPVYWSASSGSALAESELDYNEQHRSTEVFFSYDTIGFPLDSLAHGISQEHIRKCRVQATIAPTSLAIVFREADARAVGQAIIWTTTPWTLPLNDAIAYNPDIDYCIVAERTVNGNPKNFLLYLVSTESVPRLAAVLNKQLSVFARFPGGGMFSRFYYNNPMKRHWASQFLAAPRMVDSKKGTGLVHSSFCHGFEDYQLAVANGLTLDECMVDADGRYKRPIGRELWAKSVLDQGQEAALTLLKKHVLFAGPFVHSYPYDWRTKQPVIVRATSQWFLDVDKIKPKVLELLNGRVETNSAVRNDVAHTLSRRLPWCLSRQRSWGVPIPALYSAADTDHRRPMLNAQSCRLVADLTRKLGGTDFWWTEPVDQLIPPGMRQELETETSDSLVRSQEIMDVWLDSGAAFLCSREDTDQSSRSAADLVIEGKDQPPTSFKKH